MLNEPNQNNASDFKSSVSSRMLKRLGPVLQFYVESGPVYSLGDSSGFQLLARCGLLLAAV